MATAAVLVVSAAAAAHSADQQKKAAKDAAQGVQAANFEGAARLGDAGRAGEEEILRQRDRAIVASAKGTGDAIDSLSGFIAPGRTAFRRAKSGIMSGSNIRGPLASYIKEGAMDAATSPAFAQLSQGPVGAESQRQAGLIASSSTPAFRQMQLSAGQQGLAAAGDVAGITQRGYNRIGDIVSGTSAQRASALVGQTPGLISLASGANEAKLLGQIAGQNANAAGLSSLAGIAGTYAGGRK